MNIKETVKLSEAMDAGYQANVKLEEAMVLGRAKINVKHFRPNAKGEMELLSEDENWNLIINAGRIFLHTQGYGTSGLGANGLNYIALSNDTVGETGSSTTLSSEIVANGLSRTQGTVTLPVGSGNQTTIAFTFTCSTAPQACQKAALFTASSSGTMNHVLGFTQRSLQVNDQIAITFTITLG